MLSVFILAILVIALGAFLWYGWKKQKFGEHYEIYWIVSGLAIVLLVVHIFQRAQYQNFMPIVAGDVIIMIGFVMAGIIGYQQNKTA